MKYILCIGATSAIAQSVLRLYACGGHAFLLVGRSEQKLENLAADLQIRGAAGVASYVCDFKTADSIRRTVEAALAATDRIDIVLMAHGSLPDQKLVQGDLLAAGQEVMTNFTSQVLFLTLLANYFEAKQSGTIAVIGSVAGDRGRQSNYLYGSCKAGLDAFLSGLRNRLFASGVHVLTIKPGFVDSPMTAHLKKGPLFASTDKVAADIVSAIEKKKNVLYTPFFWKYILLIIRLIPEGIFKKLKL